MCGFSGIMDGTRRRGVVDTRAMALAIAHRGPDDHSDWADDALPVALSFRRLAIIDTAAHANQPMHHGPLTICFNGEIYNYKELRHILETQHNCTFKTHSDTEVLLQSFAAWGVARALPKLNGMYAIALLDRGTNTLTLARDRFGEKPLYYTMQDGALLFASELKALRAVQEFETDKNAVNLYLRYGFIPAPHTIHQNAHALEQGAFIRFSVPDGSVVETGRVPMASVTRHPRIYSEGLDSRDKPENDELFRNMLISSIDLCLRADVPVGVFLSGGIDSSLILLLASQSLGKALPSFTIKMMGADASYDEAPQAARLAAYCGSENHVLELSEQSLLAALPNQIAHMDQPLADAAILPTAMLSKMARGHVTVVLGGEGGDELQAGYTRHAQQKKLQSMLKNPLGRTMVTLGKPLAGMGAMMGLPQLERQMDKMARLYNLDRGNAYDAVMAQWNVDTPPLNYDDFRDADAAFYLPHDLLMKLDGATMGASLEGRCPYLDPDLWACVNAMPRAAWAGKKLAKRMLSELAPADLLPTAKRGLTLPLADWLCSDLHDWAAAHIEIMKQTGWIAPAVIETEWQNIQSGRSQHAQPIWTLCLFSAWCAAHKVTI